MNNKCQLFHCHHHVIIVFLLQRASFWCMTTLDLISRMYWLTQGSLRNGSDLLQRESSVLCCHLAYHCPSQLDLGTQIWFLSGIYHNDPITKWYCSHVFFFLLIIREPGFLRLSAEYIKAFHEKRFLFPLKPGQQIYCQNDLMF